MTTKKDFSLASVKKLIKEDKYVKKVKEITVTIAENEEELEFDLNINVYGTDSFGNQESAYITGIFPMNEYTLKQVETKAKRLATGLAKTYEKTSYEGIENC